MMPDPPLFVLWYEFIGWLFDKTEKLPAKARFTFRNRIENLALDIVEDLIVARYSREKRGALKRIDIALEKLRILLRICHDRQWLDHRGYEFAAKKLSETGRMVGGWRRQQEARSS